MNVSGQFLVSDKRKAVWNVELQIMDEIDRICKKYDIKYFLAGGSMLGAARHNGFIPWDDDIDVGMFREDYERFVIICKNEFSMPYYVQTFNNDKGYCYIHAKIRKSDTTAIRKKDWNAGLKFNQGIFVDIVPFDNIPSHTVPRAWHYLCVYTAEKIFKRHYNYGGTDNHSWRGRTFQMLVNLLYTIIPEKKMYSICEGILKKYSKKHTKYVGELTTVYKYKKSRRERELYDEVIDHQFEDRIYKIPKRYEEILDLVYGDWRTPKPQAPTLHGTTFYDPDHPYTDYLEGKRKVDFDSKL